MTKRTITAGVICAVALVAAGWVGAGFVVDAAEGPTGDVAISADSPVESSTIWPSTMDATSPTWEVYGLTIGGESTGKSTDEPAMQFAHDPRSGRSTLQVNGDVPARYEIDGMRVFVSTDGGEWSEVDDDEATSRRGMVSYAEPTHVRDLFPVGAEPFVTVEEQGPTDAGHLRFVVTFDADAYGRVAALERIQWTKVHFTQEQPEYVWTLDVRHDGYIVKWLDSVPGSVLTWNESELPIEFESPLR